MNKTFQEFIKWGSGWEIEAARDYHDKKQPLWFSLKMHGIWWKNYEICGDNLEELMKQAIKDGKKAKKEYEHQKRK